MMDLNSVRIGRRVRCLVALVGAGIAGPACFLPLPPVDVDESTSGASSSGESGAAEPTTSGGGSSSEPTTSGVESTSGSTAEAEGTTEFSLPTCPYAPAGAVFSLVTGADGELSQQACGTDRQFERLLLTGSAGAQLTFAVCSDASCEDCGASDEVMLGLTIPDPFQNFGSGVAEGGCYGLAVKWERAVEGEAVCTGSTVVLRRVQGGVTEAVPSLLYRSASALDVVDEVGAFALGATSAGAGSIACPCDGDCCREEPGTRDVQFTVELDGEVFMGEPLAAEQAQDVVLGEEASVAGISLVRSHFPSECAALPVHEWVFRFPAGS